MRIVNVLSCDLDDKLDRGSFGFAACELTERLGATVIGATVYEMTVEQTCWPYHLHYGVEEWLHVLTGAPVLREPRGERALKPGEIVAFPVGPEGAHTVRGPGRVVIFSAGDRGWGEAFVTVYPDSDKISAAPGVRFRRSDAIGLRRADARTERMSGGRTWTASSCELAPDETSGDYRYRWCREEWALVVGGAPTLRHGEGEATLRPGDLCCFPQGPTGAHQFVNRSGEPARVVVFTSPVGRPMSTFFPDDDTVLISISDEERLLFRHRDRIDDYWDGEPAAE